MGGLRVAEGDTVARLVDGLQFHRIAHVVKVDEGGGRDLARAEELVAARLGFGCGVGAVVQPVDHRVDEEARALGRHLVGRAAEAPELLAALLALFGDERCVVIVGRLPAQGRDAGNGRRHVDADHVDRAGVERNGRAQQAGQVRGGLVVGEAGDAAHVDAAAVPAVGPADLHAVAAEVGIAALVQADDRNAAAEDVRVLAGCIAPLVQVARVVGDDGQVELGEVGGQDVAQRDELDGEARAFQQRAELVGRAPVFPVDVGNLPGARRHRGRLGVKHGAEVQGTLERGLDVGRSVLGREAEEERGHSRADRLAEEEGDDVPRLLGRGRRDIAQAALGDDEDLVRLVIAVVVQRRDRAEVDGHAGHARFGGDGLDLGGVDAVDVRVEILAGRARFTGGPQARLQETVARAARQREGVAAVGHGDGAVAVEDAVDVGGGDLDEIQGGAGCAGRDGRGRSVHRGCGQHEAGQHERDHLHDGQRTPKSRSGLMGHGIASCVR